MQKSLLGVSFQWLVSQCRLTGADGINNCTRHVYIISVSGKNIYLETRRARLEELRYRMTNCSRLECGGWRPDALKGGQPCASSRARQRSLSLAMLARDRLPGSEKIFWNRKGLV